MSSRPRDLSVLRRYGASGEVLDELLAYTDSSFPREGLAPSSFPLPDEPHVEDWERYHAAGRRGDVADVLTRTLVQLRFPISTGMSTDPTYIASTRRGALAPADVHGVSFRRPEGLSIGLHQTPAGRVPIVVAEERADFVTLVRALTCRNEPAFVSAAQGACIVGGYNNWERIARHRAESERSAAAAGDEHDWAAEFRRLIPQKERYQDRFMLLSKGPYSDVPAGALGLPEERWLELSLTIRLEHESTHYFTRRVLGSMRNTLHDELIADYIGITLANGEYRPDWFLRFMGLEKFPRFRPGGRLERYRGTPALSEPAFQILQSLVVSATHAVASLDPLGLAGRPDLRTVAGAIQGLAARPLLELAQSGPVGLGTIRNGAHKRPLRVSQKQ